MNRMASASIPRRCVQIRTHVFQAAVANHKDDALSALGGLQQLHGGGEIGAGRNTAENTFFTGQQPGEMNRLFIGDLQVSAHQMAVEQGQFIGSLQSWPIELTRLSPADIQP